jgi:hypothetical protein
MLLLQIMVCKQLQYLHFVQTTCPNEDFGLQTNGSITFLQLLKLIVCR